MMTLISWVQELFTVFLCPDYQSFNVNFCPQILGGQGPLGLRVLDLVLEPLEVHEPTTVYMSPSSTRSRFGWEETSFLEKIHLPIIP